MLSLVLLSGLSYTCKINWESSFLDCLEELDYIKPSEPRALLGVTFKLFLQFLLWLCLLVCLDFLLVSLFLFIYLFWLRWVSIAAQGLLSRCRERGLLFVVVHGLLIVVASLVVEHRL